MSSKNNEEMDSHHYFHFFKDLNKELFLQDIKNYYKITQGAISERRICFISATEKNEIYALLMEYKKLDSSAVNALNELLNNNIHISIEEYLSKPDFAKILNTVYQQISCTYLSNANPTEGWEKIIQESYQSTKIEFFVQPLPADNLIITFTEFIHQFIRKGQTPQTIDVRKIYNFYSEACLNALLAKLVKFEHADNRKIESSLQVLFKYAALRENRKKLSSIANSSLEQLEKNQTSDDYFKKSIYNQEVDIKQVLKTLSLGTIIGLLVCDNSEEILNNLQQERVEQYKELLAWQEELKKKQTQLSKDWKNYLGWKTKQVFQSLYQNTFIGIGAELFKWLSDSLANTLDFPIVSLTKRFIIKIVYTLTHTVTSSSQFANKVADKADQLFSTAYVTPLFKVIGGSIGLFVTYTSGAYQLFRMMFISKAGYHLSRIVKSECIDDAQAKVVHQACLPDLNSYTLMTNLLLASGESLYSGNPYNILSALGSTAGNLSITYAAKKWIHKLQIPNGQNFSEEQRLALFFISTVGLEIGQWFTRYGINLFERIIDCRQAQNIFSIFIEKDSKIYYSSSAECSSLMSASNFWLSDTSSLRLDWVTHKKEFYETECQINHNSGYMVCKEPIQIKTLRLRLN